MTVIELSFLHTVHCFFKKMLIKNKDYEIIVGKTSFFVFTFFKWAIWFDNVRAINFNVLISLFFQGFVTCAYGVHIVGRVIICYGVFDALASVSFGFIIKKIGRVPIFILGALINLGVLITLFSYTPSSSNYAGKNNFVNFCNNHRFKQINDAMNMPTNIYLIINIIHLSTYAFKGLNIYNFCC